MNKTFVKKVVDEFYKTLGQKMDMKKHKMVELKLLTCVTPKLETFIRLEATIAPNDIEENKSYKYKQDFDL